MYHNVPIILQLTLNATSNVYSNEMLRSAIQQKTKAVLSTFENEALELIIAMIDSYYSDYSAA